MNSRFALILFGCAFLFASAAGARADHSPKWLETYNQLLGKYVTSRGPLAFINKRCNPPLLNDVKITYQKYDWSLNEAK